MSTDQDKPQDNVIELKLARPLKLRPPVFSDFVKELHAQLDLSRPDAAEREALGKAVRQVFMNWAREQTNPKPHWLTPWEERLETMRELDRRIGVAIGHVVMSTAQKVVERQAERFARRLITYQARGAKPAKKD